MPSLTTSSPGPGPEDLRFGDVTAATTSLSASSATSSAQVSPNAAGKQSSPGPMTENNGNTNGSTELAPNEINEAESGISSPSGRESPKANGSDDTGIGGDQVDPHGSTPSSMSPNSMLQQQHHMAAAGVVGMSHQMMSANGMPVVYSEAGAGWGTAEDAGYLMNGAYSVSPTAAAYMSMAYTNGNQQQPRRPPSQTSANLPQSQQSPQQQISIQPGSPSPASGLMSPSKAVAYSPWSGLQAPQSSWSPPGAGAHLGLPLSAWNQTHHMQQQRGGRVVPSMSPSSPLPSSMSYAAAAAAAAAANARGKYTNPPGIPASSPGMSPYGAQNSNKWGGFQTDRGLMGSAPGAGGPGNGSGLDNMTSLEHCLSDIMRDGSMQNHYRGYMNAGSMSAGMNQYPGRSMGFLDDSGVILDDGSGMGGMDGNSMAAAGFPMMLGGAAGGHGSGMGGHHPHMAVAQHPAHMAAHHPHHNPYQQHGHHHPQAHQTQQHAPHHGGHHPQQHHIVGGTSATGGGHMSSSGPFPTRPSPNNEGVPGQERFSRKVFVGGLPPDIDEEEITASFRRFGALIVDWPHKAESKSYFPPKGYAFLLFQEESSVQALIDSCIQDDDKLYLCVSSPTIKDKPVQIRPWRLTDADYVLDASMPLDPRKTVFVGGVPRPLKAVELATIMDRLYGGVCYAGIDTDPELKYPKGAGRVAFSNQQSYIAAISARFVQLQHGDIDKRVEVKPYVLDDQMCDECGGTRCGGKFAPFFCANVTCLQYYCDSCWLTIHSRPGREFHKPLVKEGADRPRTLSYHHRWC